MLTICFVYQQRNQMYDTKNQIQVPETCGKKKGPSQATEHQQTTLHMNACNQSLIATIACVPSPCGQTYSGGQNLSQGCSVSPPVSTTSPISRSSGLGRTGKTCPHAVCDGSICILFHPATGSCCWGSVREKEKYLHHRPIDYPPPPTSDKWQGKVR